jgi:hypothetical protein
MFLFVHKWRRVNLPLKRAMMTKLTMQKTDFSELVEAWWKTAEALNALPGCEPSRTSWHAHVFERILIMCGWTTEEWNEAVDLEREQNLKENE